MLSLKDLSKEIYVSFGDLTYNSEGNLIEIKKSRKLLIGLMDSFKENTKNIKKTSFEIGIPRTLIFKVIKFKKKIRLDYLLKIVQFLEERGIDKYSQDYLEKHIYSLSCSHGGELRVFIKKRKNIKKTFPFNFKTKEAMRCLIFPFGDGYIFEGSDKYIKLGYVNSDKGLQKTILDCINKTFGDVDYSKRKVRGAQETFFASILGKIYVKHLNLKSGNKLINAPNLPNQILSLKDPLLIGACISQIIDDEGSFNNNILSITISAGEIQKNKATINKNREKYAPPILKDFKKLLAKLRIKSKFRSPVKYYDHTLKKWKWTYNLQISGFDNLMKIWPYLDIKRDTLKQKIKKRLDYVLKIYCKIKRIYNKKTFNSHDIAKLLDISIKSAMNYIRTLEQAKLLKKIKLQNQPLLRYKITDPNNSLDTFLIH